METITATLPINVTKELALTMNFIDSPGARLPNTEWDIEPSSILVSGDADLLRDVESLVLDDFDLATLDSGTRYSYTCLLYTSRGYDCGGGQPRHGGPGRRRSCQ